MQTDFNPMKNNFYLSHKKSLTMISLFIISIIFFCAKFSYSQNKNLTSITQIYPGILHKRIINKKDTLIINILQIKLNSNLYKIESIKAHNLLDARETTSDLSKWISDSLNKVIAAVNADFFKIRTGGEVVNNMISNGKFVKAVHKTNGMIYPQFALTIDNKPLIEKFNFYGKIILDDNRTFSIERINSKTDSARITLYNSFQGSYTPKTNNRWKTLGLTLYPVKRIADTSYFIVKNKFLNTSRNKIPRKGFILSTNNKLADILGKLLHIRDTVKVLLNMLPNFGRIVNSTGGMPILVRNGINLALNNDTVGGTHPYFSVKKHPRTGMGFSKDSSLIYFITVDGRQESSSGVSLSEFGKIMISQGIYQGLNLDGGGSTTMVINGKVVNHPSDKTGERAVGNCLIIIKI